MQGEPKLRNEVRVRRERKGWSQSELARRSGLSRAGISAIETGRLEPSTASALALAACLECSVEDLFRLERTGSRVEPPPWAWSPRRVPCRYWKAEVGGMTRRYPVEMSALGMLAQDGLERDGVRNEDRSIDPSASLLVACCDPAVGLLASELARAQGIRLIVLTRSSRESLELLRRGLVHAAGIHLARADDDAGNAAAIIGPRSGGLTQGGTNAFQLLRVADWDEGLAVAPGLGLGTIRQAVQAPIRWVGREVGSGARQCLDELLGESRRIPVPAPIGLASDHREVAQAIRAGWADAGVCLRLACEEADLDFLSVRTEAFDLCFPDSIADDPRLEALVRVVRSATYRRLLGELPGYGTAHTGEIARIQPPSGPNPG